MKIVLISENEPFFIAENLQYLFRKLPQNVEVAACAFIPPAPFGGTEPLYKTLYRTYQSFGLSFLSHYFSRYCYYKLTGKNDPHTVLQQHNVPALELTGDINSEQNLNKLKSYQADLFISLSGNQIYQDALLATPKYGCINMHPSLLPKYRGRFPSFWALYHNEAETGATVHYINHEIDAGPILAQKKIMINGECAETLMRKSKLAGIDALVKALQHFDPNSHIENNSVNQGECYSMPTEKQVKCFLAQGKRFY